MGIPSGMELIIIALVVLLLFGGKKIPELAKGLGNGIKNFKKAVQDDEKDESNKEVIEAKKQDSTTTTKSEDSQKA
jgi:sec-independent protein translocase protein TatA